MIARYWCTECGQHHYLVGNPRQMDHQDNISKDPCLEMGNHAHSESLEVFTLCGIITVDPNGKEIK